VAEARQPDALGDVLAQLRAAIPRAESATLLALAAHVARRGAPWPRRVFFPRGNVLRAWSAPDERPALPADAIRALVEAARGELVARAEARPRFARAVLDRGLTGLLVPFHERTPGRGKISWPRSEVALPDAGVLRLFLHWEEPPGTRVDLDLSVVAFDGAWRHVGTCDYKNRIVAPGEAGGAGATHAGDLTSGPAPLGASELVELRLGPLAAAGARRLVVVVFSYNSVSFERLAFGFIGLTPDPQSDAPFDPHAALHRFDLHGAAVIMVPLTIDLEARRLHWIDVHVRDRGVFQRAGGYRAALAHVGRDFEHLIGAHALPTLWDIACIHATARANMVYVRGPEGITTYRRRDGETSAGRLARLHAGEHDGAVAAIPTVNAPTWLALLRDDLTIPRGSAGYILDARRADRDTLARAEATDLVAELAPRAAGRR
jgi:hypothetical protein